MRPIVAVLAASLFAPGEAAPGEEKPNFLLILTDDHGTGDVSCTSPLELYDLKEDPQERTNLIDRHPKVARDMESALRAHIRRGGAVPWQPPPK